MSETREKEIIEGTVEDIRFRNEQNGYTVLSVGWPSAYFPIFPSAKP